MTTSQIDNLNRDIASLSPNPPMRSGLKWTQSSGQR